MREFIKEIKYLNRNMSSVTKVILIIILLSFLGMLQGINLESFIGIGILLFSLLVHELSHGFVAYLCGDDTAKKYGRLSLNPLNHLDPIGTIFPIILILFGASFVIGWAKPVPINYSRLKNGRIGEFFVSIAGVVSNLILALIGVYIYQHFKIYNNFIVSLISTNVVLAIFNIMPIPPLDGSRVIASIGTEELRDIIFKMDRYGIFIILILSQFGFLDKVIRPMFDFVMEIIFKLVLV